MNFTSSFKRGFCYFAPEKLFIVKHLKKIITVIVFAGIVVLAWLVFGRGTAFSGKLKHLYIYPNATNYEAQIIHQLDSGRVIRNMAFFRSLAASSGAFENLTPGRFTVKKGESIFNIIKMLKNNKQDTVRFTIKRVRTIEGFAGMLGKNFITDSTESLAFLKNNDSLKPFGVDTFMLMTLLVPGTYDMKWEYTLPQILSVFEKAKENFWATNHRAERAAALGFTPEQMVTLASIVEDETLKNSEKPVIASVYINRLKAGMLLSADPTVKFALKKFDLKRVLLSDLKVQSPYNTYINKGLPPGPICPPDAATIDSVLNAPATHYLYFVAKPDFSGYHNFSADYQTHLANAKAYQEALDENNIQ
jgi:UPF0755 protein